MTTEKMLEVMKDIEQKFPVDRWKVGGVRVWPWIRILMYKEITKALKTKGDSSPEKTFTRRVANSLKYKCDKLKRLFQFGKLAENEKKTHSDAELIFYSFFSSRLPVGNVLYDQHCDPIIDYLKKINVKSLLLEQTYKVSIDGAARQNEDRCVFFNPILHKFLNDKNRNGFDQSEKIETELPEYSDFIKYLEEKLPWINISVFQKKDLQKNVREMLTIKKCFINILRKNPRAKACFIVCYYHLPAMALILACKEADILAIDIQHGSQHHPAYSKWTNVPDGGYEMLPNIFWNWNKDDCDDINEWAAKTGGAHLAVVGGYPWLDLWKNRNSELIKSFHGRLQEMTGNGKTKILFTLGETRSPISEWVLETINTSPEDWFWLVRPHPKQRTKVVEVQKNLYSKCSPKKCAVQTDFGIPLPAILQYANVHVTGLSSVIVEAEMFGLRSVATESDAVSLYQDQLKSGALVMAKDPTSLIEAIKKQLINKKYESVKIRQNMSEIMTKILNGNLKQKK